ncbi:MAG: NAD(P)-dependent alcohol dehydrogenase [Acidimicrobiales bacterium]|nr:NAD(P)-dependent alcohol dehydrogenase [Acidimicrobiales bacterium]
MRGLRQSGYGRPDTPGLLEVADDLPRPDPGPGEVLVRVEAAGLDRGTWHLVRGLPYLYRLVEGRRRPRRQVPGLDYAGVIEAVGAEVDDLAVGDAVFGTARGALAEYVVADPAKLARTPAGVTFVQAASVPVSAETALHALRDQGRVQAVQAVLILGASGGVGTYAVQLAKAFGARVTGVCSGAKVDLVRSLGADEVLDYAVTDPTDGSVRYDLILDIGGNRRLRDLRRALTSTGTLVIVGGEGGGDWFGGIDRQVRAVLWSPFLRQRMCMFVAPERRQDLELLAGHLASGRVVPSIERVVALEQVAAELQRMEDGAVRGKVVVAIGEQAEQEKGAMT